MKKDDDHCVQCALLMIEYIYFGDGVFLPYCTNNKCPNYGLIQAQLKPVPDKVV